ncbi:MAG TPA: HAD family hydrolase [Haloplasmataceae bacterium]
MKKLFVFDIDGTLIDPKTHKMPESTLKALAILRNQGHILGIATGRNKTQVQKALDYTYFDLAIMCNGGYVEINGKVIINEQFNHSEKIKVVNEIEKNNLIYGIMTHDNIYAINTKSDKVKKVIDYYNINFPIEASNLIEKDVYQFNIYEDIDTIPLLSLSKDEYIINTYGCYGYDIVLSRVTKGSALSKLLKYLNIAKNDCYAFGDADNDITMLKNAGFGVAMGNALEQVKAHANYITNDVSNNGIYNALVKLGFIK